MGTPTFVYCVALFHQVSCGAEPFREVYAGTWVYATLEGAKAAFSQDKDLTWSDGFDDNGEVFTSNAKSYWVVTDSIERYVITKEEVFHDVYLLCNT